MTHNFEQTLLQLAEKFKAQKTASEKFALPLLISKASQSLKSNPHDPTVGQMKVIFEKMEDNGKLLITRSELQNLYHQHFNFNTRASQVFVEELGLVEKKNPVKYAEKTSEAVFETYKGDEILGSVLESVFDASKPLKTYAGSVAKNAVSTVERTLDVLNLKPRSISVDSGNDKFLIVRADYETPKGTTSFLVPVEVRNGRVCNAEVFMGNGKPSDLNHSEIKGYIRQHAGEKLRISGSALLGALNVASSEQREVSAAEMALIKMREKKAAVDGEFAGQIVGQNLDPLPVKDVEAPKSEESLSFEKRFASSIGEAQFLHGRTLVDNARDSLGRDLKEMGYTSQIRLAKSDEKALYFGVSLEGGKAAFTVPMKVESGKLFKPSILLCNGSVSEFSRDGISALFENRLDYRSAAFSSPLFESSPQGLLSEIKKAMDEGNHSKAEDALNVLGSKGSEKEYAEGMAFLIGGLGKENKVQASMEPVCTNIVRRATSTQPICGHTGLPISKIYTDKHGNCRPLHRKGHEEDNSVGSFFTSKILGVR